MTDADSIASMQCVRKDSPPVSSSDGTFSLYDEKLLFHLFPVFPREQKEK